MLSKSLTALALTALTFRTVTAVAGDKAAVSACDGFPDGALKCLSDVSFTVCRGVNNGHGNEQEYFVAAGTHCEQGIPGQKIDVANVPGVATATRVFQQNAFDGAGAQAPTPPPASTQSSNPPPAGSRSFDPNVDDWFKTTATAGLPAPTNKIIEDFVTQQGPHASK